MTTRIKKSPWAVALLLSSCLVASCTRKPAETPIPTTQEPTDTRPAVPADPLALYHPYRITAPTDLPHAPEGRSYVVWPYPASEGRTLNYAFDQLKTGDILVLPERPEPYEIETASGFITNTRRFYDMVRPKGGIVGMGPGVVITLQESAFTAPRQTTGGVLETVVYSQEPDAYFANFKVVGRDFGPRNNSIAYSFLKLVGNNSTVERVNFQAAHRGFKNSPPGETGAVVGNRGLSPRVFNCEVNNLDADGVAVGTSPIMWNNQANIIMQDLYLHHGVAGMPTFWKCNSANVVRVRSEFTGGGSGSSNGSCFNFELNQGTFNLIDCTFLLGYQPNTGLHFSVGSNNGESITVNVVRPRFGVSAGDTNDRPFPNPKSFSIQYQESAYSPFSQRDDGFHFSDANGNAIPYKIAKRSGIVGPLYNPVTETNFNEHY